MEKFYKFTNQSEFFRATPLCLTQKFSAEYLHINIWGTVTIPKGYSWDGCSPKFVWKDLILGTPDGTNRGDGLPATYHASMVHDALYQYKSTVPVTRKQADQLFYEMLKERGFYWAKIYYIAVRAFGWIYGGWGKNK